MLALLGPVLAHLYEQEQVDTAFEQFLELLARHFAYQLDRGAALAEHDGFLAVTLDVDRLVDLDRTVLAFLPFLGLDRGGVGQLVMQWR